MSSRPSSLRVGDHILYLIEPEDEASADLYYRVLTAPERAVVRLLVRELASARDCGACLPAPAQSPGLPLDLTPPQILPPADPRPGLRLVAQRAVGA